MNRSRRRPAVDFLAAKRAAPPRYVWWKKIRNKAGQTGWTQESGWAHADACG